MTRLEAAFAKAKLEGRPALITYVIPGYPSREETATIFTAMAEGGADIIEVGIPFSDPLADGATIQRASFAALQIGVTPRECLEFVRAVRPAHPGTPIVLMTYLNLVLAYGLAEFAADAAAAGADAVIIVDLPPEESGEASAAFRRDGLDLIYLVTPTSSDKRMELIASKASGFIYCVSVAGVTGARQELPPGLDDFLSRVRRCTILPLAVGFGISRREHIQALTGMADGVVVASAIIDLIAATDRKDRARSVCDYMEVLSGRPGPQR